MDKVIRLFLSQPMTGIAEDTIAITWFRTLRYAQKAVGTDNVTVVNKYIKGGEDRGKMLLAALNAMPEADYVVFAPDWNESAGCRIERALAEYMYKPIIETPAEEAEDA